MEEIKKLLDLIAHKVGLVRLQDKWIDPSGCWGCNDNDCPIHPKPLTAFEVLTRADCYRASENETP